MKSLSLLAGLSATLLLGAGAARADVFTVTYNEAGSQAPAYTDLCATTTSCLIGTESFDAMSSYSSAPFTTDFGTGGVITGSYSGNLHIYPSDQYGGAGNVGKYIVTFGTSGYQIDLSHDSSIPGVNYFGFWLSALDAGNELQVLREGVVVGTYSPANLVAAVSSQPGYYGNPNGLGNGTQPYALVNFFDQSGFFDEIRIFESPQVGGYESDNHAVGYRDPNLPVVGTVLSVPEPASLAVLGVGLLGFGLIRRRQR